MLKISKALLTKKKEQVELQWKLSQHQETKAKRNKTLHTTTSRHPPTPPWGGEIFVSSCPVSLQSSPSLCPHPPSTINQRALTEMRVSHPPPRRSQHKRKAFRQPIICFHHPFIFAPNELTAIGTHTQTHTTHRGALTPLISLLHSVHKLGKTRLERYTIISAV